MYLDHHIIVRMAQIFENIDLSVILLDSEGSVILPEGDKRVFKLPEAFKRNAEEPFVYGGLTLIGTKGEHPLYLCLPGDSKEVAACARLSMQMISMLLQVDLPHANAAEVLRYVLREEISGSEMESLAQMHNIPQDKERCVMVMHLNDLDTEMALNILENLVSGENGDEIVEVDKYTIALIKAIDDQTEYADMEQIGLAIENTFYTETSHPVYIGVGEPVMKLSELGQSYREARKAIDVGRVYRADSYVFIYRNLLLERFLSDVPADMATRYNAALFNRKSMRLLNDEMIVTIEKFFENNLNLSETARQLYIHRNTLVYRLDKVQRVLGLDLRLFEDAVTFKLMMLLGKTPSALRNHR